jgi:site-specific recombinase XerD
MESPLRRSLQRAGISRQQGRIGWHNLRHTYASHLAMRGVPLKVIQELMGHTTIEMTERYAHLRPRHPSAGGRCARRAVCSGTRH